MIRIPDLATMAGAPGAGSKLAYWGSNSDRTYQVGLTEIRCNDFTITGMNLEGNITDAVLDSTTGAGKITNCVGYESRRSGTTGTVTPDANGNVSITHGLSKAPNWADVKILGDVGGALAVPQTTSATTITARLFTSTTGADITAGNFVLMWSGCTDRAG